MAPVDLKAYIRSSGVMANPKNLETAELLMTTGLKDSGKDRHWVKKYEGKTPWKNVKAMHDDLNKLPHGPTRAPSDWLDSGDVSKSRVQGPLQVGAGTPLHVAKQEGPGV